MTNEEKKILSTEISDENLDSVMGGTQSSEIQFACPRPIRHDNDPPGNSAPSPAVGGPSAIERKPF